MLDTGHARVRLRDVAARAGVSTSTASRVLSGSPRVSPAARRAVLDASDRLGYRGDRIARALRTRRTGTVGMLVPDIANPFFAELIESVTRELEVVAIDLLLADSHGSVEAEARWLVGLSERRVDGLLVVPVHHHRSRAALERVAPGLPLVQLDREVDGLPADFVGVDNDRGCAEIVAHLRARGVERVAVVDGPESSSTGRQRALAFERAVAGSPSLTVAARQSGEFSTAFGREAARRILARAAPDAIVCGSDIIALGVMAELRRRHVAVPDEVLVTGFDGIMMAELTEPALTTVVQPCDAIAAEACRLLELRLGGDEGPARHSLVAPRLAVRGSTSGDRSVAAGAV
ncbi:MAG TPA: LacI family DNA-binding transcriptional regulator [Solirubrobacteraceae bacterium]|nr:LacI family DNA-binding transcriptional regulator [Solirubrobacteraceae bacterium]